MGYPLQRQVSRVCLELSNKTQSKRRRSSNKLSSITFTVAYTRLQRLERHFGGWVRAFSVLRDDGTLVYSALVRQSGPYELLRNIDKIFFAIAVSKLRRSLSQTGVVDHSNYRRWKLSVQTQSNLRIFGRTTND
jgi:hypothetical protein